MAPVGIVANPASGKDIRRLVASGTVVGNREKINIIVRALLAMDAMGSGRVLLMPDPSGIGARAADRLAGKLRSVDVEVLELPYLTGTAQDTIRSVRAFREMGCSCIVVMGGDGTCRIAAKESAQVPLVPVSTGTNNVFPQMVEGTLVGLAAAALERDVVGIDEVCERRPRLELVQDGEVADIALVDLAVVNTTDFGARAVWQPDTIDELFLTRHGPANIGLSAIGGCLSLDRADGSRGLHLTFGEGGIEVTAPIAPGLLESFSVAKFESIAPGDLFSIGNGPAMVALDGEREVLARAGLQTWVRLSSEGPLVVPVERALTLAAERGMFTNCALGAVRERAGRANGRIRQ